MTLNLHADMIPIEKKSADTRVASSTEAGTRIVQGSNYCNSNSNSITIKIRDEASKMRGTGEIFFGLFAIETSQLGTEISKIAIFKKLFSLSNLSQYRMFLLSHFI